MKVTLNDNLFRYPELPEGPALDLCDNLFLAHKLIKAAVQFFHLNSSRCCFKGYVSPSDGDFTIELWGFGRLFRTLCFPNLGYSGVLHVEVAFGRMEHAVGQDLLGDIYGADTFYQVDGLVVEVVGDRLIPAREPAMA